MTEIAPDIYRLFTMIGNSPALTEQEITGPALSAEDLVRAGWSLTRGL